MPPTIRSAFTRPPVRVARPSWFRRRVRPTCLDTDRGRALVIARSWRSRREDGDAGSRRRAIMWQARVENAFFRYKSIIGDSLRACSPAGRGTEVVLACNILNQMTGLGRPMSYRIGR